MEEEQTQIQVSTEEIMSPDDGSASSDANVGGGSGGGGEDANVGGGSGSGGGGGESSFMAKPPAPFVLKTYHMVDDQTTNHIISWDSTGTSFIVWQPLIFAAEIMRHYFRHNNFSSFVTQLSTYNFSKISWDKWEFQNEYFQRGNTRLLKNVIRKRYASQGRQQGTSPGGLTSEIPMVGNGSSMDQEIKNLRDEHTLLDKEMMLLKKQIEESRIELEMLKKQSEICKRNQNKLVMFVKQEVLLKEGIGLKNEEAHVKLERMLMDDGGINYSECVGEEETGIYQPNNAIDMEDLIEGPADWAHYINKLRRN